MAAAPPGRGAPLPPGAGGRAGPRPQVASLNAYLTCRLCKGYLVDAMTLIKCLHSFCRSCILKHLETGHTCPVCDLRLSKINMESHLMRDDILQNVVYKAVPGLYQKEMKRRRDFYSSKGNKGDQASLNPEEKGELDSSSSGRVIFSPDEAVSLSLEYKPIVAVKTEPEASGPSGQEYKEPAKRYLNCPAAMTIALLQKFLRMKYSISARYKVDILYMDDVLWSHYMLMDVAYIYSWKRDIPLQLFYRVSENVPKPAVQVASQVEVRTSASSSLAHSVPQPSGGFASDVNPGIDTRGPTILGQSASVAQESRGCTKEAPSLDSAKPVDGSEAPSAESPVTKPGGTSSSITETKVQSKTNPAHSAGRNVPAYVTAASQDDKAATTIDTGTQLCSIQQVPDIHETSSRVSTVASKTSVLTLEAASPDAVEVDTTKALAVGFASIPGLVDTIATSKLAATSHEGGDGVSKEPASCIAAKVPTELPKSLMIMEGTGKEATARVGLESLPAQQTPSQLNLLVDTVAVKAALTVDGGSSARTAGFVLRHQPKAMPPLNGIDKGLSCSLVKSVMAKNEAVNEEVVKEVGAPDETARPMSPDTGAVPESKKVEDEPETQVQTCISRAAHKAEAKMNALKAAAALLKENIQSEKDTREPGGLSVTLRANRISCRSNSEGSADKRPQRTTSSQGDLAPKNDAPASKPPTRAVTPPLPVIPSYLTLSKSHPSLFHASPRKRGRPKLATVNSLNEEIERAHMARSNELAATDRSKPPPPVIPVITSLKIKPIPPPPPQSDATPLSSLVAPREQPELRPRSKSQGDASEEKSDAEDSMGRRKSKRKHAPAEMKTVVTHLKELRLEKGQAATQEPLRTLAGGTPGSKPSPDRGQEKITLRVTRDEKCNLKVEKQLRPAVVSETLHDSGFCEDVLAESSVPSPVPDTKQKGEPAAGAAAKARQLSVHQDTVSSTSKGLEQIATSRHMHHGTKKDLRKSKRKSVEEWVNEQSKWVRSHEVEAVKHQGTIPPPNVKSSAGSREPPPKPGASLAPKEAPTKVQRRGRKRTNPVKIEKPVPMADAQQENSVSASLQVPSSSTEAVTLSAPSAVEKEASPETASRNNSHSPKGSSKGKQESDHPKKSPELVIPRYIPNAATSVPLTVTHARNKRLRESDRSSSSGLDLSARSSAGTGSESSPEKDSEKSKFFKEALNLSMKETEVLSPISEKPCSSSEAPSKLEETTKASSHESLNKSPASADEGKVVTKSAVSSPIGHGAGSQLNIHQVVEKISSFNSCKVLKNPQDGMQESTPSLDQESKAKSSRSIKGSLHKAEGHISPGSSFCESAPLGNRLDSMSPKNGPPTLSLGPGARGTSNGSTTVKKHPSEQSPESAEALVPDSVSPGSTVSCEILPRINETGVFRLEFPAAEVAEEMPAPEGKALKEQRVVREKIAVEQPKSYGTLPFVAKEMSESVRNIVRVQESMMELRQGTRRLSCSSAESRATESVTTAERVPRTSSVSPSKMTAAVPDNYLTLGLKGDPCSRNNLKNIPGVGVALYRPQVSTQKPEARVNILTREVRLTPSAAVSNSLLGRHSKIVQPIKSQTDCLPTYGGVPVLKTPPAGTCYLDREKSDSSRNQMGQAPKAPSPARSPLLLEAKSPSPLGLCGTGTSARTTDTKVNKLQKERNLWRPAADILSSKQLAEETALQRIAANKSISIGQAKEAGAQAPHRNQQKQCLLDVPQVPRSLSVSIVTRSVPTKGHMPATQVSHSLHHPVDCLKFPRHLSVNSQYVDFVAKESLPQYGGTSIGDGFLGPSSVLSHTHPELSVTSKSDFKSAIHIPASLSIYATAQQKGSLSPPATYKLTQTVLPEERFSPPRLHADLEQPRVSPRPSDKAQRSPLKDTCRTPEGHRISSSNEAHGTGKPHSSQETSGMPSPKASENMYRTTVAELDLFTTLSIIETMKGRATVHDIIDDYITNLGSFFCTLERAPVEMRLVVEDAFSVKEKVLLQVIRLLKKLTTDLSSSQLTRVLALEALVERFLRRCGRGRRTSPIAPASSEEALVTSSEWGISSTGTAIQQLYLEGVKDGAPAVVVPELDVNTLVVSAFGAHFRCGELRKKAVKRLKCSLTLRDLVALRRKPATPVLFPGQPSVCRRIHLKRSGGYFAHHPLPRQDQIHCLLPHPATSVGLPTKSLARLLPAANFGLPQGTVIVDALSSLLTGYLPHLVNRGVPQNGLHSYVSAQSVASVSSTSPLALQAYRDPGSHNVEHMILSALSQFLSGQQEAAPLCRLEVASHLGNQQDSTSLVPAYNHLPREEPCMPHNLLLVEATAESSLVISSPQSNSKLVIGPNFDMHLLSRLLDGLKFIPKTQGAGTNSWINSAARTTVGGNQRSCWMLTGGTEAPDQRLPATLSGSGKAGPLAKPKALAKPEAAVSRRFLRKRALAASLCKAPVIQKRRRLASNVLSSTVESPATRQQQQEPPIVCPPREAHVVPKDCVVVLRRLELLDDKETLLKECRSLRWKSGSAQQKKKPKLSVFPALSGVHR